MKHLLLLVFFMFSITISGYGEASAAPAQPKDKVQKVEHKENTHDAILTDASSVYRICNGRPQRILPNWFSPRGHHSKLPYFNNFSFNLLKSICGQIRNDTAPIHFDVANKYYVICLRHLRC